MSIDYSDTITRHEKSVDIGVIYKEYDQYNDYLPKNKNASILEIGSGEGYFLKYLVTRGYTRAMGIDTDKGAVERCEKNVTSNVKVYDAQSFLETSEDNMFDAIVMNNTIEHFHKEDLMRILRLIYKKMKSNGVFIAKTGNIENPINLGLFLRDFTHQIGFTKNSLRQVLLMSGFDKDKVKILDMKYCSPNIVKTVLKRMSFSLGSNSVKALAKCMSMRIDSMSKLIFCVATKE